MKHSAAYYERQAKASRPRVNLKARDAEYRRMLGVSATGPLPTSIGETAATDTGKGRRGRLVRKVRNKARNTTMNKAVNNVR